jgi:hypothetical protein
MYKLMTNINITSSKHPQKQGQAQQIEARIPPQILPQDTSTNDPIQSYTNIQRELEMQLVLQVLLLLFGRVDFIQGEQPVQLGQDAVD